MRLRNYPFLLKECQIYYLQDWSYEAYYNIGKFLIHDYSYELKLNEMVNVFID